MFINFTKNELYKYRTIVFSCQVFNELFKNIIYYDKIDIYRDLNRIFYKFRLFKKQDEKLLLP